MTGVEVLGEDDRPQRPPGPALVGVAAGAVLAAGLVALAQPRPAPLQLRAEPTGVSTTGDRLRVWLAVSGPPRAAVDGVDAVLPGADVEADGLTPAFSARGVAAVRLSLEPRCPAALDGLDDAALQVAVADREPVHVPFATDGLLTQAVRARCVVTPDQEGSASQPVVRGHRAGPDGAVRVRLRLTAAGADRQDVLDVLPAAGVRAVPVTPLPVGVPRGGRRDLLVDLLPVGCAPAPEDVPLVRLTYAGLGPVSPRVDGGVRTRLERERAQRCT